MSNVITVLNTLEVQLRPLNDSRIISSSRHQSTWHVKKVYAENMEEKKVWLTAINYWKMKDSNFDIFLWFEVWQKKPLSAQILLTYEFCILQLFTTEVIVTCSIKLSGLALPFMEFQDPGYKMSKIFCIKKNQQAQRKISNFENWTRKP